MDSSCETKGVLCYKGLSLKVCMGTRQTILAVLFRLCCLISVSYARVVDGYMPSPHKVHKAIPYLLERAPLEKVPHPSATMQCLLIFDMVNEC